MIKTIWSFRLPTCFILSPLTSNQLIETLDFALPSVRDPSAHRRVQRRRKSVYPPTADRPGSPLDTRPRAAFPGAIPSTQLLVTPILLAIANNGESITRVWCLKHEHGRCLSTWLASADPDRSVLVGQPRRPSIVTPPQSPRPSFGYQRPSPSSSSMNQGPHVIPSNDPASQYTLLERLGIGSFGTVYKAYGFLSVCDAMLKLTSAQDAQ